ENPVQIYERIAAFLGNLSQRVPVNADILVLLGRVGKRPAQVFLTERGQDDDAGLGNGNGVQQCVEAAQELGQAGLAFECFILAVADDNHSRLVGEDVFLE